MQKTIAIVMTIMIATNFLVAIPVAQASEQYTSFKVIAMGEEPYIFDIAIEKSKLTKAEQTIEQNVLEIAEGIELTEEQRFAILTAKSVRVLSSEGNYIEVLEWIKFVGLIQYGAFVHMYLTAATAINVGTALDATIALFGLLTGLFFTAGIPVVITLVIEFVLAMIRYNYYTMYSNDHNSDNSFDVWFKATILDVCTVGWFHEFETPRYRWLATMVGAYITYDKTNPPVPNPVKAYGTLQLHMK